MRAASDAPSIIDLEFLNHSGVIASFLLGTPEEAALIETGPSSTVDTLLAALRRAGIPFDAVRHLLVTHIHLDHAGAAGTLLQLFPNASLYVHERGAPHLIDPGKLIASASRIYGSAMDRLWGRIEPVPAARVVTLHDGDHLQIAGLSFEVLYTPGHASHHVVFRNLHDGSLYTGDTAGVRMQGCSYVHPPTPPPDLDLDLWEATLDRLAALHAPVFYATHYGRCEGTDAQLQELRSRLRSWEQFVLAALRQGDEPEAIAAELRRRGREEVLNGADEETVRRYEVASAYRMNVSGFERYLRKRYQLPPGSA